MTENLIPNPLTPLERRIYRLTTAEVLRRLLASKETGQINNLWFPFPQKLCCFAFGPNRDKPLPIGTLFLLWNVGSPYVQDCPDCGCRAYMISFGGLLAVGGGNLICTGCGYEFYQSIGGLPRWIKILDRSSISNTPFRYTKARFGRVFPSDGAQLCSILGVEPPYDGDTADDEVFLQIDLPSKFGNNLGDD